MTKTNILLACFSTFFCSTLFTWLVRLYALKNNHLDVPNARSSHHMPTPRGGGLAIVTTFTCVLFGFYFYRLIDLPLFATLAGGGLAIALIGHRDDIASLRVVWRIVVHGLAASWAIYWLGPCTAVDFVTFRLPLPMLSFLVTWVGIIWCINLYNFMDGIDGLAGSEGLFIYLSASIALSLAHHVPLALLLLLLAMTIAGFIVWNWSPAKIFLGDVGSGYLGYLFAVFSLKTANENMLPMVFWWFLIAVFFCDATFTLLHRMLQGKKWYSAHREHAYQYLILSGATHQQVTISIFLLNMMFILPLAFMAFFRYKHTGWLFVGLLMGLFSLWSVVRFTDGKIRTDRGH